MNNEQTSLVLMFLKAWIRTPGTLVEPAVVLLAP
jgi:hypothetical protein